MTFLNAQEYAAEVVIGVVDRTMSEEETSMFLENMRNAQAGFKGKRVIFTWTYWDELTGYETNTIQKAQVPFVMVKQADDNWMPYYYINGNQTCSSRATVKVESAEDITTFVK